MRMKSLLAIDAGLRTGFALYGSDGRLCWYRSQHFGNMEKLKRGAYGILKNIGDLHWLIIEGSGDIGDVWLYEAKKMNIITKTVSAETWRRKLLYIRERRNGAQAKKYADGIARQVITWSEISAPTSLHADTAEAILIGLWGALETGLLKQLPRELQRSELVK